MPNTDVQAAAEGLPQHVKIIRIEDAIGEAQSFIQAVFLAAAGLGVKEDANAIQLVASEAEYRLTRARELLDELRGA
jgi:hypothetical protein